jgi:hypothetical protein
VCDDVDRCGERTKEASNQDKTSKINVVGHHTILLCTSDEVVVKQLLGRSFTWSNEQPVPTMTMID